jgi:alkylation response protein AidB-like acyl-CoA dehydrogenase
VDLTLSPSEQAFSDELRAWLEANHPGDPPSDDKEAFEFSRRWQRKLHEGGYAGLSWPKEYGGRGATLLEQAIFYEELVRAKAPRVANVLGLVMGGPVVITHGTEEQKKRYLEPILSAEEIWCQGFSEPDAGSDLASLKTRAVKQNGEWVVTGQKVWTTLAHEAKWCMLVARTDPDAPKHQGLTYFLMDMEQDGVEVKPLVQITGEAEFNEIFMEEARIPDENVIGGVGNGWAVAITTLMNERAGLAFAAQAALQLAMRKVIDLAGSTVRNGKTALEDPIVREELAQLFIESEIFRVTNYRGLTKIMKNGVPGPEGSLGKWQWAEVNQRLMELAFEIEGPYAQFSADSSHAIDNGEWQYQFLRTRANSIEGGTTEILKNIVAERVLGLPKLR